MSMLIFKPKTLALIMALGALSLAGCKLIDTSEEADAAEAEADTVAEWQDEEADSLIECALGGSETFAQECMVERTERSWQTIFIVHHPDGGFRRFDVVKENEGDALTLETSDGADQVEINVTGEEMRVQVARDRYVFPADLTAMAAE